MFYLKNNFRIFSCHSYFYNDEIILSTSLKPLLKSYVMKQSISDRKIEFFQEQVLQ